VVTWQASCTCGWTGLEQPAVDDPKYGTRNCPEDLEERVFFPGWRAHVARYTALSELGDLAERLHDLEREVDDKVALARGAGASWAQIGRATGLTRQGAQQRWGSAMDATAYR
jgi:hypothetical protein